MVHGRRSTSRSAACGGPYPVAVILLLAVTLLHAMLTLGAGHVPPSGPDHRGSGAVAPAAPAADEDGSPEPGSAVVRAREGGEHPAGHTGHAGRVRGASAGAHRSLPTTPGPLAVATVRGRLVGQAAGVRAFGAGGEPSIIQFSSRTAVLRC
ncbi:hypothetical protein ABZS86_24900 [Streptomyces sp. NPDC005355]|uniref:hypothetical protein n=1 Tax=Streptomyces sp. NPDC005355 TaxID=3157038 RepID=UPI0033AC6CA2